MNKNKKHLFRLSILCLTVLFAWSASSLFARTAKEAQEASAAAAVQVPPQKTAQEKPTTDDLGHMMVKTYELKFISASEFMRSARFYVVDSTGTESSLTVRIFSKNVPDFEALLKKLDVEKKNIQFQVYTIVASKDDLSESVRSRFKAETKEVADRDLRKVLDEMKGLWNFKHYWIETPSFMIAKDGAESNRIKLVSDYNFELLLRNVHLRGEDSSKRMISVGEIRLIQSIAMSSDVKSQQNLIDTSDVTFKEKGYLVVGVSGLSSFYTTGLALILVISAEIK